MTTPEQPEQAPAATTETPRKTRPEVERSAPFRNPATGVPPSAGKEAPAHPAGVRDPDVLAVNEAVAHTVKSAYEVLSDTIGQGRRAAEQFRVGTYNVRDVPDDMRHMAANLLGLARQLSSATFDICEALLRQADGVAAPPPPGSTQVPAFHPHKTEAQAPPPAAHAPPPPPPPAPAGPDPVLRATPQPAPKPAAAPAHDVPVTVRFDGKQTARAHTTTLARPQAPTGPDQIACDGLALRGGGAELITRVAFEAHPSGHGLAVMVMVPHEQPPGVYAGSVYCATQSLPLGLLVIEIA